MSMNIFEGLVATAAEPIEESGPVSAEAIETANGTGWPDRPRGVDARPGK